MDDEGAAQQIKPPFLIFDHFLERITAFAVKFLF